MSRMEQVQMHIRIEPGKFSRSLGAGGLQRAGPFLVPLLGRPGGGIGRSMRPMGTGSHRCARS